MGTVAKGWWSVGHLGRRRTASSVWRWRTRLGLAAGGEDQMLQLELGVPLLFQGAAGVRARWLSRWIYQRRELGVELDGVWPEVNVLYDSDGANMAGYYRRKVEQGTYDGPWTAAQLWPGWQWRPNRYRLLNRVNRFERVHEGVKEPRRLELALPEGAYPVEVELWCERVRFRWQPWRDRADFLATVRVLDGLWLPFPGKGENSWDCGDDGFQEVTVRATTYAQALAGAAGRVLRQRERYGGPGWKPEGVGVMRR